jgi:hypothetical protein
MSISMKKSNGKNNDGDGGTGYSLSCSLQPILIFYEGTQETGLMSYLHHKLS